VIVEAVWNQRQVRVRYWSWDGEADRTLQPLGVVLKGGVWYVAAEVENQLRTYRASSIRELAPLDGRIRAARGIRPGRILALGFGVLPGGPDP
jgi:predicted DNA-binding transcriptional regulator YafY